MSGHARISKSGVALPDGPVLRILFYIDSYEFLHKFSTHALQDALTGGGVRVQIDVKLRVKAGELVGFLDPYHEVWFFLLREKGDLALDVLEIAALLSWMNDGGGVLLTGDHAAEGTSMSDKPIFVGLGSHVGRVVPRARHMRAWDSEPGVASGRVMTTDPAVVGSDEQLEQDAAPQRLLLPVQGDKKPHPIFRDARDRPLDRLPDHAHEGLVRDSIQSEGLPDIGDEWPRETLAPRSKFVPTIVAMAVDWRLGTTHALMAQWDGHLVARDAPGQRYGRILADSSFHHYVDENLGEIAAAGGENWRKITELFRNQAAWLAPARLKHDYREVAFKWLCEHPYVLAARSAPEKVLGEIVGRLLVDFLPGAWLRELVEDLKREVYAYDPAKAVNAPTQALFLGAVVHNRLRLAALGLVGAKDAALQQEAAGGRTEPLFAVSDVIAVHQAIVRHERMIETRQKQLSELRRVLGRVPSGYE